MLQERAMKEKRGTCFAVNAPNDFLVALGSYRHEIKSVENFDFHQNIWHDLPSTIKGRVALSAVIAYLTEDCLNAYSSDQGCCPKTL